MEATMAERQPRPDATIHTGEDDGPRVAAHVWHASLSGTVEAVRTPEPLPWKVVHLADTPDDVRQPALLDDVICLHGGGAKEVQRVRVLRRTTHDIARGALTVLPRGRAAQWRTRGPIAYTHIVLSPKALDHVVVAEFEKGRDQLELNDEVGFEDRLLERLFVEMVDVATADADRMRLYKETLFTAATLRLFHRCSTDGMERTHPVTTMTRGGLPGWRLRRVVDYVHEHRASDLGYDELTGLVGLSRAQFFRAFKQSLGASPGRYLERVRLTEARRALERGASLEEAAAHGGFPTITAMTRSFRRCLGISPTGYRSWYR